MYLYHVIEIDKKNNKKQKTKKQGDCAPSEDSDQPGHPPSLIRVFAVAWRKLGSLVSHAAHSKDSDQTWQMPRLIWVFAGRALLNK